MDSSLPAVSCLLRLHCIADPAFKPAAAEPQLFLFSLLRTIRNGYTGSGMDDMMNCAYPNEYTSIFHFSRAFAIRFLMPSSLRYVTKGLKYIQEKRSIFFSMTRVVGQDAYLVMFC